MNSLNTFLNDLSSSLLSQEEPYSTEIQQNLATSQKHQNRLSEVHAEMERMQQENDPMTFIRVRSSEFCSCVRKGCYCADAPSLSVCVLGISVICEEVPEPYKT